MLRHEASLTSILPGAPDPQGATWDGRGVNFALWARHAASVELCLFDDASAEHARLPLPRRTGDVFHGYVPGLAPGQRYGYRVHGPYQPRDGHRYNPRKLLIDPYALALDRETLWSPELTGGTTEAPDDLDSGAVAARSVVVDPSFDWEDDRAPCTPWRDTVIYECHVKGLSKLHPALPQALRGTFAGLAAPPVIDHLTSLGVTAVELLPVQQAFSERFLIERGQRNYWGYNTIGWFAPDARFASALEPGAQVRECKQMVRALHRAGIEVILDVVYNHSGEADALGPTLSLRGIDNASYYRLDPSDRSRYVDTTGCGNSLDLESPQTLRLVLDSLRYWAEQMHVDGFRFDLAPTLARTSAGVDVQRGFFAVLAQDPALRGKKLIVEPWDAASDGVRRGAFAAPIAEWNDLYRDCVRRYWLGIGHGVSELATRLSGSADLFQARSPLAGISYVTCHDGFTLRDLVSYDRKRNDSNGWDNRDGSDGEPSTSFGASAATDDPATLVTRSRVQRALLATLGVSLGVPMLRQGDELGQSQRGNNNAYGHDDERSWVDWAASSCSATLLELVRSVLRLRRREPLLRHDRFLHAGDVVWLTRSGKPLQEVDWRDGRCQLLGMWRVDPAAERSLLVWLNASEHDETVSLPELPARRRFRVVFATVDTAEPATTGFVLAARSLVVLAASARGPAWRAEGSESVRRLAQRCGIVPDYIGYDGVRRVTGDDTRVALLAAMGVDASTEQRAGAALRQLTEPPGAPRVAALRVLPEGADALRWIDVELPPAASGARLHYSLQLRLEGGERRVASGSAQASRRAVRLSLRELHPMPLGYHELLCELLGVTLTQSIVVTPRTCLPPQAVLGARKACGLVAHVYALQRAYDTGYGHGDLADLAAVLRFAAGAGMDFVGVNPLHAVDPNRPIVSPYYPISRLFRAPLYIEVEAVPGLLQCEPVRRLLASPAIVAELRRLRTAPRIDYAGAWRAKRAVLRAFYDAVAARGEAFQAERERLRARHGGALTDFATFCAIAEHRAGAAAPVYDLAAFPSALRDVRSPDVAELRVRLRHEIDFHVFLQAELDRQLEACQREGRSAGMAIGIFGDLAVGSAPSGADVWANPDLFARGVSLGAPPDFYSARGQTWGLLPLLPRRLLGDGHRYFAALCRESLRHAGMLRVDHMIGFMRQLWVPDGAEAAAGAYVRAPFEELCGVLALESHRAAAIVVGEDLGLVPRGLRERMAELSILRSHVVSFERRDDGEVVSPGEYSYASVASVGTHDTVPLAGLLGGQALDQLREVGQLPTQAAYERASAEREQLVAALRRLLLSEQLIDAHVGGDAAIIEGLHRLLARSGAALVAVALDDLCGETRALNVPGAASTQHPSWARRPARALDEALRPPTLLTALAALRSRLRP